MQRHKAAIEERVSERLTILERNVTQQQQLALERLEQRGGETWRSCLQRMSALEEHFTSWEFFFLTKLESLSVPLHLVFLKRAIVRA